MVGRGEVLERMTTVDGPVGPLEALYQGGGIQARHRLPVLVCPPHPRLGGGMDSAVCAEIVWHLARDHHPTLRFNYRGASASVGELSLPPPHLDENALPWFDDDVDVSPLVDDARAALAQLRSSTGHGPCLVVGISVGALVAARLLLDVQDDDGLTATVDDAILVAPPLAVFPRRQWLAGLPLAGDGDGDGGGDGDHQWGEALARARDRGDRVSVLTGQLDRFAPPALLERALGTGFGLQVVDNADHSFQRGLPACGRLVASLLRGTNDDDDDDDDGDL